MTVSRSYHLSGNNEKRYPYTSGTPDLDKVPKLRTNHSDKGNQANTTQCYRRSVTIVPEGDIAGIWRVNDRASVSHGCL